MWPISTDVAQLCVSVFFTRLSCAKTAEPIMSRLGFTHMGPGNHILDGGRNPPTGRDNSGVVQPMHWEPLLRCMQMTNVQDTSISKFSITA